MGGLLRLIVFGAIIWFIYNTIRRALGQAPASAATQAPDTQAAPAPTAMRKCSDCGMYIPEGESTQSRGHYFCNEAHRDHFLRQQG